MYLFITSIILALAFLTTLAFQIAYIFIYKKNYKKDPIKTRELTTPLEYFYTLLVPLIFIQLSSLILNNLAGIRSEYGQYVIPTVALIFGSIYNTVLILLIAFIFVFKVVLRQKEKLTFITSIVVSLSSILVSLIFTIIIL